MRHFLPTLLFLAASLIGMAVSADADTLRLKDGSRLEGEIRRTEGGYNVTDAEGNVTFVEQDRVAGFELGGGQPSAAEREDRLASLRRSVENLDDLAIIIDKYERFLEQHQDTRSSQAAREDLARWKQYQSENRVKYAGQWITPAQRDEQLRQAFEKAAEARLQIKNNEVAAAQASLMQMLRSDPKNVSALYLQAVLAMREDDLSRAKALLEQVRQQQPTHAPTLLNLATINFRQNHEARGLLFLGEAMSAEPVNREILDNVAEALAMLEGEQADSRQARQVRQTFLAQDAILRQQMSERGLYRWGGRWVDRQQHEKLQEIEQEVNAALQELEEEYRRREQEVAAIDEKVRENERYLQRLRDASVFIDPETGRIIQQPLPPVYYDVEREQQELARSRSETVARLREIQAEVRRQKSRYPTPPYTGQLTPIGEDGVPVVFPEDASGAATQPATQPAVQPATESTGQPTDVVGEALPGTLTTQPTVEGTLPDAGD